MFLIDSKVDKPDYEYLENRVNGLLRDGIRMKNTDAIYKQVLASKELKSEELKNLYNIDNPNSTKQIVEVLEAMDDETVYNICYDGFKWTTNKTALCQLADKGYDIALSLLSYRKIKNIEAAIRGLREVEINGMIHPTLSYTKTNRITYKEPALMNIPKSVLWNVIGPKKDGDILISADIKNQEPFIIAHILKSDYLKLKLNDMRGLYEAIMADITDIPCEGIVRKEFKAAWNCLTYGGSSFALKAICLNIDYKPIQKWFNSIPEFKSFHADCDKIARTANGKAEIESYFGTKMSISSQNKNQLKRIIMDAPVQGTGADIMALLVKHFDIEVAGRGLAGKLDILFPRIDELVINVDGEYVKSVGMENVKNTIKDILEHKIDDWEPFRLDVEEVKEMEISSQEEEEEEEF